MITGSQATDPTNMGSKRPTCSCQSRSSLHHWRLLGQKPSGQPSHHCPSHKKLLIIVFLMGNFSSFWSSQSLSITPFLFELMNQIQEEINKEAEQFGDILQVRSHGKPFSILMYAIPRIWGETSETLLETSISSNLGTFSSVVFK